MVVASSLFLQYCNIKWHITTQFLLQLSKSTICVVPGILIKVTVRMSNKYCLSLSLRLSLLRNICFAKPNNEYNTMLSIDGNVNVMDNIAPSRVLGMM